jgi:spermidine/putrescine-binding protein
MRACARFAAACLFVFLAVMPRAAAGADLVILTNQGATPGVKELAAAFERASGHKVSVIQVEGDALEQRIASGSADLVTANPPAIEDLVKKRRVIASTVTPFVQRDERRRRNCAARPHRAVESEDGFHQRRPGR